MTEVEREDVQLALSFEDDPEEDDQTWDGVVPLAPARPDEGGLMTVDLHVQPADDLDARPLGPAEARRLTNEVKNDLGALGAKLLRLYEGEAWKALHYESWAAYCEAEFDFGRSRAYQLLDAGRVLDAIESHSTMVDSPPPKERHLRELAPLLRKEGPEVVAKAWATVRERHGDSATDEDVRRVAAEVLSPPPAPPASPPAPPVERPASPPAPSSVPEGPQEPSRITVPAPEPSPPPASAERVLKKLAPRSAKVLPILTDPTLTLTGTEPRDVEEFRQAVEEARSFIAATKPK